MEIEKMNIELKDNINRIINSIAYANTIKKTTYESDAGNLHTDYKIDIVQLNKSDIKTIITQIEKMVEEYSKNQQYYNIALNFASDEQYLFISVVWI